MKIAYLVNVYPSTSHSFIRREIHALEAQGIEVLRFTLRPGERDLPTPADREEARRTRCVLGQGPFALAAAVLSLLLSRPGAVLRAVRSALTLGRRSDRGVLVHLAYVAEACLLFRWVRDACVDHVHAHFATNPAAVALLCRELGGPTFSFTVHGPHEFDMPAFIHLREKVARAAFTVSISSFGRSQLCRWARYQDWSKLRIVHCGVPRELLAAQRTPVPDNGRLVCVARLGEQKGHLLLVEAAARLAGMGKRFELVLIGDGPMRGEIEALIRRHHLEDSVRLTGSLGGEQVHEAILASRAMVLPSFAEGLPVVLMEALAAARPVVTTAIAGTPELVRSGVNGWLVPAGSVEALVEALSEVLATPVDQLSEMGRRGAELVAREHDVDREARRLAELFRGAVDEGLEASRRSQPEALHPAPPRPSRSSRLP